MEKKMLDYVTEKTNDLIKAETCCKEAKAAGQAWLKAAGTDKEAEETRKYIAELEEDILPIDGLIAFTESPDAVRYCGLCAAGTRISDFSIGRPCYHGGP